MQQEQTKNLIVNILTGVVVVGVLATGYFVFMNKGTVAVTDVSVVKIAEETRFIGTEIDRTVKELEGLDRSLASSLAIFGLPAFRNLQDFSVSVPDEAVGRSNPFIPTQWKMDIKAFENAQGKSSVSSGATSSSVPLGTQSPAPAPTGNINSGI